MSIVLSRYAGLGCGNEWINHGRNEDCTEYSELLRLGERAFHNLPSLCNIAV